MTWDLLRFGCLPGVCAFLLIDEEKDSLHSEEKARGRCEEKARAC